MSGVTRIKPKRLCPGDTIGVVAPAGCGEPEATAAGITWLEEQGFRVRLGENSGQQHGYLAGTDAARAGDLNAMFASPEIDGILCLRGGYGTMRLLDLLDYETIRQNPKAFIGYSDITALHLSLGQRAGLVTFHGPMLASDMANGLSEYSRAGFFRAIANPAPLGRITNPPLLPPPSFIVPGTARGQLCGGNLSLIAATLGTPYEIDTRGRILCLEEVGEAPYRIDRMLTQLMLAGKLQAAAGIVFAVCADCDAEPESPDFTLAEVLQDRIANLKGPVLGNVYFGHTAEKATLPLGVMAELSTQTGGLTVVETAIL